jgi:hypothetical protein
MCAEDVRYSIARRTYLRVAAGIAAIALAAIAVFGTLAWRSITVEQLEPDRAARRFDQQRALYAGQEPVLRRDASGDLQPSRPAAGDAVQVKELRVLAYRSAEARLVSVSLPFWFLKMKGPPLKYTLRDTGLDLERLGITPADLERYGPALILDEIRPNGDRLLVWTE